MKQKVSGLAESGRAGERAAPGAKRGEARRGEAGAATAGLLADGAASTGGGQPGARRSGQVRPGPRGQRRRPTALAGRRG